MGHWDWRRHQHTSGVSLTLFTLNNSRHPLHRDKVYIAPSGVQKEQILPAHIFVLQYQPASPHTDRIFLRRPTLDLKESACTPLFWNAFDMREAGSCIHTHSQNAVMATLLWPGKEFTCSHLEMIKGVRVGGTGKALSYLDTLTVPIIENTVSSASTSLRFA